MAAQALEVVFHGATLLIVEHSNQPYVPMKPVVSGMGLDWKSQFAKLASNKARWGMAEITIPTTSGPQGMACLPLRKLPGWLATISPNKVRPELREKIAAYQNEADDVLWEAWQGKQAPTTITAAQQQHLKELVDLVAESGKQTHAETWARFHRKFSIPRYTELPAAQFDAACQYLLGKLDQPAIAALIQKHLPGQTPALPLTGQATQAAYQAAHQYIDELRATPHSHTGSIPVQVLQGVLADALMSQRFLLSVHPSHGLQVQAVPKDACVLPSGQWASAIECNDVYLAPEKLAHLHAVVSAKISSGYLYMHRQRKGQPPALT